MSSRKGFTVIDLLASIFAMAMALPMAMGLARAREMAKRASCATNLSNIGKGLAMYTAASDDQWPWVPSSNQWSAATGEGRAVAPSPKANYNVSALLFQLVRDGQAPGIFICPSTEDMPDPNTRLGRSFAWDFSPCHDGNAEHVSYSYQAPMTDGKEWTSGVSGSSDSGLVVSADRTPAYEGLKADFDWTKAGQADTRAGMSQNHGGEYINMLYADTHVGNSQGRADEGIYNDNIYSCAGLDAAGKPLRTNRGAGTLKLSEHRSANDSFLMGPTRMATPPK